MFKTKKEVSKKANRYKIIRRVWHKKTVIKMMKIRNSQISQRQPSSCPVIIDI